MVRVIISNHQRKQLVQLQYAANVTWKKGLNSIGYASFDLPLSDPYCTPTYLNPANYVHIFSDTADSSSYANAEWGGQLVNDFEIKPKGGVATIAAAGLANLLEVSIVSATTIYNNLDIGSIVSSLITHCDNFSKIGLTQYSIATNGDAAVQWIAGFGDSVLEDIYTLCSQYGYDFEVRPDFTYGFYIRQGVDRPDLVARYGNSGNVQVDSTMKLVNTELGNQIYWIDQSANVVFTANQTSVQYYGPSTIVVQDFGNTYVQFDALTKAQIALTQRAFPLYMMDNVTIVDSPLLPYSSIELGDRITFEAPSLPMLSSFNGLQRILTAEYNDRDRVITLTLGNAVYKVRKNNISEVHLYSGNTALFGSGNF